MLGQGSSIYVMADTAILPNWPVPWGSLSARFTGCGRAKRRINEKFILGAIKAFPQFRFHELFYVAPEDNLPETPVTMNYRSYESLVHSR